MKFLSAYVAGFGKLVDFRLDYDPKLTVLCMENGWGKSTLAYFHKAMLYGLDSTSKARGEAKERVRFRPWTSAPFGGWIEFEDDSHRCYRIERSFGRKASDDRCTLYSLPDLQPSNDYSDPIGLTLFGLNARCFIRSVFCSGTLGLPPEKDDPDSTLLVERFGDSGSDNRTKEAINKLEIIRRDYQTKTADRGKVPELRRNIAAYETEIEESKRVLEMISQNRVNKEEVDRELNSVRARIADLDSEIKRLSEIDREKAVRAHGRQLSQKVEDISAELERLSLPFGGKIPDDAELERLTSLAADCDRARARLAALPSVFPDEREFASLSRTFATGLPDSDSMSDYRDKQSKIDYLRNDQDAIRASKEFARRAALFEYRLPSDEELDARIREASTEGRTSGGKPGSHYRGAALIGGALLAAVGILLGIVLSAVFFALVPIGIVLGSVGFRLGRKESFPSSDLDSKLPVGYRQGDEDLLSALNRLKWDARCYRNDLDRLAELSERENRLATELSDFLDYYSADDLRSLSSWIDRYAELTDRREDYAKTFEQAKSELAELDGQLRAVLERYPVDRTGGSTAVRALKLRVAELSGLETRLTEAGRDLSIFLAANSEIDLNVDLPEEEFTADELRGQSRELGERRDELIERSTRLDAERAEMVAVADRLPELWERLEITRDQFAAAKATLEAILNAEKLLSRASENLSNRYLSSVRSGFDRYMATLLEGTHEVAHYQMDSKLEVLSEEAGSQRSASTLSRGRQDLVALAARLSLADALFEGRADFLILDDPFVALDDGRLRQIRTLLARLSEDRQILYLTCSESRMP